MEVQHDRCAGLDLSKDEVVACVRIQQGKRVKREIETFGTTTQQLLRLCDWLTEHRCTHVVMESTGVYWQALWQLLEGSFEGVLANASHVKALPGRKTDVCDAQWLADLLAHGLVRPSFVPPQPIQQLRDLTRTRKQFVEEKSRHVQRVQKVLERANIKLSSVLTDIMGRSGRAVLDALIDGESDPEQLLALVDLRVKASREQVRDALEGLLTEHLRGLLRLHMQQIGQLEAALATLDQEVERQLEPFRVQLELLKTIPGVGPLAASVIVAEIGVDMSRFPTAGHLVSWAGLCPGNDKSAGKTRSRRARKGNRWLKSTLVQSAHSASRARRSYLRAQYHRLRGRRGSKKAAVAVSASILAACWHMLRDGTEWNDLGPDYFDRRDPAKAAKRLVQRIEALGYTVQLQPA